MATQCAYSNSFTYIFNNWSIAISMAKKLSTHVLPFKTRKTKYDNMTQLWCVVLFIMLFNFDP